MQETSEQTVSIFNHFCFLRLGLVTGLVEKESVVAWADDMLVRENPPDFGVIELSLSRQLSLAQVVGLLNRLQGKVSYDMPLKLLFARAGGRLAAGSMSVTEIIQGLRLLLAETYLPVPVRQAIGELDQALTRSLEGLLSEADLRGRLAAFLEPYALYTGLISSHEEADHLRHR
jgi:hypothetical protein